MKKKIIALLCALTLTAGMSTAVMAASSPSGTTNRTKAPQKSTTAPKTDESNVLGYGAAAVLLLGGTSLAARNRSKREA